MKCVKVAAAIALCLGMGQAFAAQTCGTPTALTQAGVTGVNGCGETDTVSTLCVFNANPSPDTVFSFTLAAGFTATAISLVNHTGTFTPQMILQVACGDSTDCTATSPASSAGGNTALTLTGTAPGAYFLIVDGSSTSSATDCGSFDLTLDGTLPVQLQKFSVD